MGQQLPCDSYHVITQTAHQTLMSVLSYWEPQYQLLEHNSHMIKYYCLHKQGNHTMVISCITNSYIVFIYNKYIRSCDVAYQMKTGLIPNKAQAQKRHGRPLTYPASILTCPSIVWGMNDDLFLLSISQRSMLYIILPLFPSKYR